MHLPDPSQKNDTEIIQSDQTSSYFLEEEDDLFTNLDATTFTEQHDHFTTEHPTQSNMIDDEDDDLFLSIQF